MPNAAPIAIIGLACRFPGGADSPRELWRLLDEERDATADIPASRFDVEAWRDNGSGRGIVPGRGGFIHSDIRAFDTAFFGIPPAEAEIMDPQFRLLLELGYEALEDAGQPLHRLSGGDHGTYVGVCFSEYRERLLAEPGGRALDSFLICGTTSCSASGRLAFHFGFEGPALTVDAACSSSLLTVHLACRDLRSGEIDLALAGGVNLMLSPQTFVGFSRLQVLSPDGRCKGFDARADGYGRAEGAGLVCLKRLDDALRDHDRILAVIEGTGLTNDGAAKGYTAPRPQAQTKAVRKAMVEAGITADDVDMIEAHGTGTRLGDRVEIEGLAAIYAERDPALPPAVLGAVKGNLGHAEAAAGSASLIKVVLALQAERMPAHLWGQTPNPAIQWPQGLRLGTAAAPWPKGGRRRRAGVNSFGMSGVNVHVVVAEAPDQPASWTAPDQPILLWLSARTPQSLSTLARAWIERLKDASPAEAALLAASQAHRRSTFPYRITAVGRDGAELRAALALRLADLEAQGVAEAAAAPQVAVVHGEAGEAFRRDTLARLRAWGVLPCAEITRDGSEDDAALAARLARQGADMVVEIAERPFRDRALAVERDGEARTLPWVSALCPDAAADLALLAGRGRLHELGANLSPHLHHPDPGAAWVDTPRYPWSRQVYWVEAAGEGAVPAAPPPPLPAPVPVCAPIAAPLAAPVPVSPEVPRPTPRRADDCLDEVCEALAAILGLPAHNVDPDAPMAKLGLDSLMAINLATRLSAGRQPVSPTVFWNHPTARKLARHLSAAPTPAPEPAPLAATADADIEAQLDEILERLG
ncbi:MAG TPA: beta-ketoacyl synthase N-terminal-like domain-containing protein [Magnetospirillum sp.]|nr:beta-ketoacyl synthase N-terminal-like domain-containing protein [Magnetospirillum sp.]